MAVHPKHIPIADYSYSLPEERIAVFPLQKRDASKLLVYRNGEISEGSYHSIADQLPSNSLLIFNNTSVFRARVLFQKPTGGLIEIFCLEPLEDVKDYQVVMQKIGSVKWKCMIGGAGKWKEGYLTKQLTIGNEKIVLRAKLLGKMPDAYEVELSWEPNHYSFSEIIEAAGNIPLPPYIKRLPEESDKERYQTIYASEKGSVAAPTAGLHFTDEIFLSFAEKNIIKEYVTLHVGAGTFKPVKAALMQDHEMHAEWIDVTAQTIENLISNLSNTIIATGTTSLRTIESLFWMGVKTQLDPKIENESLLIKQWDVYEPLLAETTLSNEDALKALLLWMKNNNSERLIVPTQILIAPGYEFRLAKGLITNFHQPQSTLLLLVAAAIGSDWKKVYDYAMENDFRFLSYGDGSLLLFDKQLSE